MTTVTKPERPTHLRLSAALFFVSAAVFGLFGAAILCNLFPSEHDLLGVAMAPFSAAAAQVVAGAWMLSLAARGTKR